MPERFKFLNRPLFLQVRDELAARIANGIWKPGSAIPNEAQLSAELSVSQSTVRKALDLMEAEKILIRRQGRGTFVIDHDTEVMAIRFSSIVDGEGRKIEGEISCQRTEVIDVNTEVLEHLDAALGDKAIRNYRLHTYHAHPFMWEYSTIVLRHWPNLTTDTANYDRITSLAQRCGVILSHATETVWPQAADAKISEKLSIATGTPILYLQRTLFNDRGIRVEWREAWTALRDTKYRCVMS